MPARTEGHTGPVIMGDSRNDMILSSPVLFNIPGPTGQAILDWSMLVETYLDLFVWVTLDVPVLLYISGRPVQTSQF